MVGGEKDGCVPQYGGEQVIEVMRDAPGESAYGLCSLYMAEMVPHPLPFLDLQLQIPPGRSQALDQRRLLQGAPVQEEDVEERQGHRCQDSSRKRKREVVVTSPADPLGRGSNKHLPLALAGGILAAVTLTLLY